MTARNDLIVLKAAFALLACLLLAENALAYTVPAPELVGQFMALAGWAAVAMGSVLLYPVYAVTRWFGGKAQPEAEADDEGR